MLRGSVGIESAPICRFRLSAFCDDADEAAERLVADGIVERRVARQAEKLDR